MEAHNQQDDQWQVQKRKNSKHQNQLNQKNYRQISPGRHRTNDSQKLGSMPPGNISNKVMTHNVYVDLENQDQPTNQGADESGMQAEGSNKNKQMNTINSSTQDKEANGIKNKGSGKTGNQQNHNNGNDNVHVAAVQNQKNKNNNQKAADINIYNDQQATESSTYSQEKEGSSIDLSPDEKVVSTQQEQPLIPYLLSVVFDEVCGG